MHRDSAAKVSSEACHERHPYREDCPGCQLRLIDPLTGRVVPEEHPASKLASRVWWEMPLATRAACQRVWVHNSRNAPDLAAVADLAAAIEAAARN